MVDCRIDMSSVSSFERNKPRKTHKAIQRLINKYKDVVANVVIVNDEDCIKIEMAADFIKELEEVISVFKSGE